MFRITINNEEVLCDKDFTIKEEMLNTPSVILNNVYPKTWETSKDYTTNFYHPEDYSKCIIGDETYMTESQGTTVSGSNLFINYDKRRFYEWYGKGNIYQNTTTGKNLLKPNAIATTTKNGITASYDRVNQVFTFNGTCTTDNTTFSLGNNIVEFVNGTTKSTTYWVSGSVSTYCQMRHFNADYTISCSYLITTLSSSVPNQSKTTTSTFTCPATQTTIRFNNGSVANNFKIKIMVANSADTTYEPYTNGVSPNPEYPQEVDTTTGGQEIIVENKNIARIKNSLWYNSTTMVFQSNNVCYGFYAQVLPSTTYTISKENEGNRFVVLTSETEPVNNSSISRILIAESSTTRKNYTFTTNSKEKYVFFGCYRGNEQEEQELACKNVQIEQGNQITQYEEHKQNSYEVNLGKQMIDLKDGVYTGNGITATVKDGEISLTGTATAVAGITIPLNNKIDWIVGDYYTVSAFNSMGNSNVRIRVESNGGLDTTLTTANAKRTIQYTTQNMYKTGILVRVENGTVISGEYKFRPMLTKGSFSGEYARYKEPIELCKIGNYQDFIRKGLGSNIFKNDVVKKNQGNYTVITDTTLDTGKRLKYTSTTTTTDTRFLAYAIMDLTNYVGKTVRMKANFRASASNTGRYIMGLCNEDGSNRTVKSQIADTSGTTIGFTVPELNGNQTYLLVNLYANGYNGTISQNNYVEYTDIIITIDDSNMTYEPYGYKDKWYIYRAIGKVVLNGSETWTAMGWNNKSAYRTSINNIFIAQNSNTFGYIKSNYFRNYTQNELFALTSGSGNGVSLRQNQSEIIVRNDTYTTVADFKTWLSTNNTNIYYVLETPTISKVRDTELISQLEKIKLMSGINNININSGNSPLILDLHYNFNPNYYYVDKLYFSGVVKNSGDISLNPRYPHYSTLQILDFKTFLSEGETLDFVIADKTILEAIQMVVDAISEYGFVLGNVNILTPNDIIGAYSTENKTAYDVFNYIADITQSRWTTRVIDDNTVAIDFYDPTLLPEGKQIEYNQNWFCENLIDDMSYSYNAQDYRNKQVMTSNEIIADITQTETLVANGYDKNFITEQKIGKVVSITLNGVEKSIITNGEKDMGFSADFHYGVGNNYFENSINIPLGSIITITYYPIIQGRQIIKNNDEINRIATSINRKGVVSRYENRNDSITSLELQKIGQSYIKYKGTSEILLTIQTRNDLWNIGDRVFFNAPIDELKKEYMVKEKEINYIKTVDTIFYTFTLSSSFNSENAINYFDNQRAKMNGNIEEGDFISRNIDIENSMNIIFQNATAEIIQIDGDNRLQSTLTSPLTN